MYQWPKGRCWEGVRMFSYASLQIQFLHIIYNNSVSLERHIASISPDPGANLSERNMLLLGRAELWEHAVTSLASSCPFPDVTLWAQQACLLTAFPLAILRITPGTAHPMVRIPWFNRCPLKSRGWGQFEINAFRSAGLFFTEVCLAKEDTIQRKL